MSQPGLTTLTQRHIYDRAISCTDSSNLGITLAMTVQREREREKGKVEGRQGGVIWERSEGPRSSHI